ncbi:hypothetical protein [Microbulbifer guangxiensis]|uniref:hypothetical protein n=1 Tax=Microbulbifer guangxiensis TaxID=2904249 RepID=UPI001F435DDF|nr:hypothetical protein [Microbulbifer guangxiensis]
MPEAIFIQNLSPIDIAWLPFSYAVCTLPAGDPGCLAGEVAPAWAQKYLICLLLGE